MSIEPSLPLTLADGWQRVVLEAVERQGSGSQQRLVARLTVYGEHLERTLRLTPTATLITWLQPDAAGLGALSLTATHVHSDQPDAASVSLLDRGFNEVLISVGQSAFFQDGRWNPQNARLTEKALQTRAAAAAPGVWWTNMPPTPAGALITALGL